MLWSVSPDQILIPERTKCVSGNAFSEPKNSASTLKHWISQLLPSVRPTVTSSVPSIPRHETHLTGEQTEAQ